jgi:regulator of protease activity HflC (stomatin/prohibitin superfamily)
MDMDEEESRVNLRLIGLPLFFAGLICVIVSMMFIGTLMFVIGVVMMIAGSIMIIKKEVQEEWDFPAGGTAMMVLTIIAIGGIAFMGIVTVDAGEKGVVVSSPAGNIGEVIDEGWHFDPKYVVCTIEKIRVNKQTTEYVGSDKAEDTVGGITVLTQDNLTVDMDMAVTYHIPEEYVSSLRLTYGSDWKLTILHQEVRSVPRLVCAQYNALEIVGESREYVEQAIKSRLTESIESKGIVVDNVVIRELRISNVLTEAVQQKLAAQQMLEKAQIDLQRIQVEAQASAEAVDKVRGQFDSDEAYLQYILYRTLGSLENVQVILSDNNTATVKVI